MCIHVTMGDLFYGDVYVTMGDLYITMGDVYVTMGMYALPWEDVECCLYTCMNYGKCYVIRLPTAPGPSLTC